MRLQGEQWLPELCDELPKDEKKKDAGKLARKDKDPGHRCGGKARNKWPKGKGNKLNNPVLLGKATYDRSVHKFPTVSVDPGVVSETQGSLARMALRELLSPTH